ncbi:MAG: heptosyltransferase-2 [Nonlabens sp.]|uniref:hypothetical protein n=1 Tax=Nonlabens sp. TaxID=1888209 RepID=UPI0039E2CD00
MLYTSIAKVLDRLAAQTESQLLFNFIPRQKKESLAIYTTCGPNIQQHTSIDAFAPSIRGFLKVLPNCDSIISNKGGAMNMDKA